MADNKRTQVAAAIKRASNQARLNANKLDRQALDQLTILYKSAANDIRERIEQLADADGLLKLQSLQEILDQIESRVVDLGVARDALLTGKMGETAVLAVQPFLSDRSMIGVDLTQVAHDAVQTAQRFIDSDGLQLSDRLWRLDNNAKRSVSDAVQLAIIKGNSAANAANDFISRGEKIPGDISRQIQSSSVGKVSQEASAALLKNKGNAYSQALRVFRTEINRAHGTAYSSAAFEHPDVVGTRFLLSPNHPEIDICDMHAKVNRYGLGPGVYPKGKSPWPAHPNTLSYEEVVFKHEITPEDKAGKQNRIDYLNGLRPGRQNSILGRNKGWMLREGLLTENAIRTPWAILKDKLEKQNIDLPVFRFEGPLSYVPGEPGSVAPVSDAFNILAFKSNSRHVLDKIDGVHSDGVLPTIPIKRTGRQEGASVFGVYQRTLPEFGDNAVSIALNATSPHKEFTLAHEIGHFIDHKGLPGAWMSSEYHPAMDAWRKAVAESPEVQWLEKLYAGKDVVSVADQVIRVPKAHLEYLLRKREIWARSYSQWIAMKSGDEILERQLNDEINSSTKLLLPMPGQWRVEHFEPIADAIESLFKQMGWI